MWLCKSTSQIVDIPLTNSNRGKQAFKQKDQISGWQGLEMLDS